MDDNDWKTFVGIAACTLVVLVLLGVGLTMLMTYQCERKWRDSGMQSEWALAVGCRVQLADGRWLPAENLRDIDLRQKDK